MLPTSSIGFGLSRYRGRYFVHLYCWCWLVPMLRSRHPGWAGWIISYLWPDRCWRLYLGNWRKTWFSPFCRERFKTELLMNDGSWKRWELYEHGRFHSKPTGLHTLLFHFKFGDGERLKQHQATMQIHRLYMVPRMFLKLGWFAKAIEMLEVEFDSELGKESGTYKGGVCAVSFIRRDGESREQAFWRMMREHEEKWSGVKSLTSPLDIGR